MCFQVSSALSILVSLTTAHHTGTSFEPSSTDGAAPASREAAEAAAAAGAEADLCRRAVFEAKVICHTLIKSAGNTTCTVVIY